MNALPRLIARLVAGEHLVVDDPDLRQPLLELGADRTAAGEFVWPAAVAPLDSSLIEQGLESEARAWLRSLEVLPAAGSTNSLLLERGSVGSIDGVVVTAECQLEGRGRLGRRWLSPLGTNLAISIGLRLDVPPAELGGSTLVVGLALLEALDPEGLLGLSLKWPNDVFGPDGKLAGILVELATHTHDATELVIGIGINLAVPAVASDRVPQAVQNLYALPGAVHDRNRLLASVVSAVVTFLTRFAESGFEPFVAAFNQHHRLQGRTCTVSGAGEARSGRVVGIDSQGGLLLETAAGTERVLSGELSIRVAE
ncbi:MAG: biotin--[acetyl-CoA-carboxylase] ligase [Pseudomonadota bacterium]